jgi:hypothetical protein
VEVAVCTPELASLRGLCLWQLEINEKKGVIDKSVGKSQITEDFTLYIA